MVIRSEQMALLNDSLQNQYHHNLRGFLRQNFPQLVARLDDRALLGRIQVAVPKARSCGIRSSEGILAYVGLSIAAGPAFHSHPKVCGFLESRSGDPDLKTRWLFQRVVEKLQRIVAQPAQPPNYSGHQG